MFRTAAAVETNTPSFGVHLRGSPAPVSLANRRGNELVEAGAINNGEMMRTNHSRARVWWDEGRSCVQGPIVRFKFRLPPNNNEIIIRRLPSS